MVAVFHETSSRNGRKKSDTGKKRTSDKDIILRKDIILVEPDKETKKKDGSRRG